MTIRDYFKKKIVFKISDPLGFDWMNIINDADDEIDFEVILEDHPDKIALQRPFVWTLNQQQSFIISVFKRINIPPIAVLLHRDGSGKQTYQIIDGKQRLTTLIRFYNNEFSINVNGKDFFFKDLDSIDVSELRYALKAYIGYNGDDKLSGRQKRDWFELLNFSGTAQESEHMQKLKY